MSATREQCYDVIVVGGGPAGATSAALIAREGGHRVLLLERETFPRFRIGESLMPATHWTLERLGVADKLSEDEFVRKHSVQFYLPDGRPTRPFYFNEVEPGPSAATWQVERSRFDQVLLDHARESGVEVVERANVRELIQDDAGRVTGVRVSFGGDSGTCDLGAKVVVDASGQSAICSRAFQLKRVDPKLRHLSFYTRYRGVERDCGIDGGATVIYWTRGERSWFWFIPIDDELISVGVVGPVDHLAGERRGGPERVFDEELAECPALAERLAGAERVSGVAAIRDFSYVSERIAGDGWVSAGDAFGFLDPMYSTGVFLALRSAEFAADSVLGALAAGDCSAARLGAHGPEYIRGMEAFRKLVYAYYDPSFSFATFLERYPHLREPLVHLLMGNVWRKPMDELLEALAATVELPDEHGLRAAEG